jgi:glycosyltransferase involved in cell wall biosynthesis
MSLTIVMPSFNEEKIIGKVVRDFYDEISAKIDDFEFIVIDSSSDKSPEVLKKLQKELPNLKVIHTPPQGHGKAIVKGYELAAKDYVFQVDSDNQFSPEDFWKLYEHKDKSDFILGVRQKRKDPLYRRILSAVIRFANLVLFGVWVKDINCPFRLMKRELLCKILNKIDTDFMAPNILIVLEAKKDKANIIEVPVTHFERKTGNAIASLKLLRLVCKGFIQLVRQRFKK